MFRRIPPSRTSNYRPLTHFSKLSVNFCGYLRARRDRPFNRDTIWFPRRWSRGWRVGFSLGVRGGRGWSHPGLSKTLAFRILSHSFSLGRIDFTAATEQIIKSHRLHNRHPILESVAPTIVKQKERIYSIAKQTGNG